MPSGDSRWCWLIHTRQQNTRRLHRSSNQWLTMRPTRRKTRSSSDRLWRRFQSISRTNLTRPSPMYLLTLESHQWRHKTYKFQVGQWMNFYLIIVSELFGFSVGNYSSDALLPVGNTQPPGELLNFIEKQESYIEQLEKESNFCRVSFEAFNLSQSIN